MNFTQAICLQCATIFPVGPGGDVTKCPNCSWSIGVVDLEQLCAEATRVLKLGHAYREMYEEQIERDGEVTSMACLIDPPAWVVFASVAALSGVIGNASYEAVKTVIKRLYAQRSKQDSWKMVPLGTDSGIEVFVRHTREYVNGMSEVDVTVRQYIEEEERADLVSKTTSELVSRLSNATDPEMVNAAVKEAVRTALQKIKAGETSCIDRGRMQQLLSDIWSELPAEQRSRAANGCQSSSLIPLDFTRRAHVKQAACPPWNVPIAPLNLTSFRGILRLHG